MKPALIYARVSSEAQASEEKASIPTQLAECRQRAAALGLTVLAEYIDAEKYRVGGRLVEPSGTRADRPAFLALIAHARRQAGQRQPVTILAWREDRLYRGIRAASAIDALLDDTKTSIELAAQTFDKEMLGFRAAIGRYELAAIRDRTKMGIRQRVGSGLPRGRAPAAYQAHYDPATGAFLRYVFDEQHRAWFEELARRFIDHQPYNVMARALGVNPATGARLSPTYVRRIILDPFYRGQIAVNLRTNNYTHADALHAGQHSAVWDAPTCAAIEAEIERRARLGRSAPRGPAAIFTGVLKCGLCGRSMGSFVIRREGRADARAYRCRQPDLARYNQIAGPAHAANNVRQTSLQRQISAGIGGVDHAGLIAELRATAQRVPDLFGTDGPSWQQAHLANLQASLTGLEHDLANVASPLARQALEAEKERLEAQIAISQPPPLPDLEPLTLEKIAAGIRRMQASDIWSLPIEEIRAVLIDAFPAGIYVAGGKVSLFPPKDFKLCK